LAWVASARGAFKAHNTQARRPPRITSSPAFTRARTGNLPHPDLLLSDSTLWVEDRGHFPGANVPCSRVGQCVYRYTRLGAKGAPSGRAFFLVCTRVGVRERKCVAAATGFWSLRVKRMHNVKGAPSGRAFFRVGDCVCNSTRLSHDRVTRKCPDEVLDLAGAFKGLLWISPHGRRTAIIPQ
jgi:hypothetical protein